MMRKIAGPCYEKRNVPVSTAICYTCDKMRIIGVVTGSRADYSSCLPVLRAIEDDKSLRLVLFVTGAHLDAAFGNTVELIEADGFRGVVRVPSLAAPNDPKGICQSIANGVAGFGWAFKRARPDILVALGDRFEILAAVLAATIFNIPIAHIAGGELTLGALDDCLRHAITKMSHLHFVTNEAYRQRIIQMGEEPWRVTVTGSPALDNLKRIAYLPLADLEGRFGLSLAEPPLVVTFHPETLAPRETTGHVRELLAALECVSRPILITGPNADAGSTIIRLQMERFAARHSRARFVNSMSAEVFYSLLRVAGCMVGNSSSGVAEAGSFELPTVNVGNRQEGRLMGKHILQASCERGAILRAVRQALRPSFRKSLIGTRNPYGEGGSVPKIVRALKRAPLGQELLFKRFQDSRRSGGAKI